MEKLPWVGACYWLGATKTPDYLVPIDQTLAATAQTAGEHWSETFLRLTLGSATPAPTFRR